MSGRADGDSPKYGTYRGEISDSNLLRAGESRTNWDSLPGIGRPFDYLRSIFLRKITGVFRLVFLYHKRSLDEDPVARTIK